MSTDTTTPIVEVDTPPTPSTTRAPHVDPQPRVTVVPHLPPTGTTDGMLVGGGLLLAVGAIAALIARRPRGVA